MNLSERKRRKEEYNPYINRETCVRELLGLKKYEKNNSEVCDAIDEYGRMFEIKCPTGHRTSTKTTTNLNHIQKWKRLHWIIAYYNSRTKNVVGSIYYIPPQHMLPWVLELEKVFLDRMEIHAKIDMDIISKNYSPRELKIYDDIKKRSLTLHDPRIPKEYVLTNGIRIFTPENLRREVDAHLLSLDELENREKQIKEEIVYREPF